MTVIEMHARRLAPLSHANTAACAPVNKQSEPLNVVGNLAYALHMLKMAAILRMVAIGGSIVMRTVSIFKNGKNQAIRFPNDMSYEGVSELEITRSGDTITLRPVRPNWLSLADLPKADADFMAERQSVISDEGRFTL